jgi:hypothetical protein
MTLDMKRVLYIVFVTITFAFWGCDSNTPHSSNKVITGVASEVTSCSAVLSATLKIDESQYRNIGVGIMLAETQEDLVSRKGELVNGTLTNGKGLKGGDFMVVVRNLLTEKQYFYCAVLFLNNQDYEYGEIKTFTTTKTPTTGKTLFSISKSKKVLFSPGNLQYQASAKKWRFAENQWECVGQGNENISTKYDGWIDLFGWSTSAGTAAYGVNTSTENQHYSGDFVDWGNNRIGDDVPGLWRTLSYDEWGYVVYKRPNAESLRGIAQVNGINGLILLPDNWLCPSGITFKSGCHADYGAEFYADYQSFSIEQWAVLENEGAVFLPAANVRIGNKVDGNGLYGNYWSSSDVIIVGKSYNIASYLTFYSDGSHITGSFCEYGLSVRLVKDL